jgi:hypothetical protein
MARSGIAEKVRRRVVGHGTVSVLDSYNQVDGQRHKDAIEAIP